MYGFVWDVRVGERIKQKVRSACAPKEMKDSGKEREKAKKKILDNCAHVWYYFNNRLQKRNDGEEYPRGLLQRGNGRWKFSQERGGR